MQQLIEVAGETYDVEDTPIEPHVACGVAVFPDHGYDGQQVFRAAELAMTVARQQRKPLLTYESSMEPDPRNLTLMRDLNKALTSNALSWVYQPKYSLGESRVIGAEMLIRWRHPRYGWLSPALFIPLADPEIVEEIIGGLDGRASLLTLEATETAIMQGYGIAKPMPLDEFVTFAADYVLD